MGKGGIEAEDGARTGDANDHLTVLRSTGGQFEIPAANQIEAARVLSLSEEGGLCGQADGAGYEFEVSEDCTAEGAEPSRPAVGTCCTADRRLAAESPLPPRWCRGDSQVRHFLAFHTVCPSAVRLDVMGLTQARRVNPLLSWE